MEKKYKKYDYLVMYPEYYWQIKDGINYSFANVYSLNKRLDADEIKDLIDFINNNMKTLIIVNFDENYRKIIPYIKKHVIIKCLFSFNFSYLTDGSVRYIYDCLMEFYDRKVIKEFLLLDDDTNKIFNAAGMKSTLLYLDIERSKNSRGKDTIGIIGNDYNPNHNIYNELSAIKLTRYNKVKIDAQMEATKHFLTYFDIDSVASKDTDDLISGNVINLYCNFTNTTYVLILKSMDMGIPCILGNTSLFDNYSTLKRHLVLNSDDDINEIASKVNTIDKYYSDVMKEYDKFRSHYSEMAQESIKVAIGG